MYKKICVLVIVFFTYSLLGMNWVMNFSEGIKQASDEEKPVLFLFLNSKQKESLELSYFISKGQLDCLEDKFILVHLNISKEENLQIMKKLKLNQTPVFVLQDHNPKRKLTVKTQFLQPKQLFNALFDIYSTIGNQFMKIGDTQAARESFLLISEIPNEMGVQADNAVKKIDKMNKNGTSGVKKVSSKKDAKKYYDMALVSIKNKSFDKAYLYLQKAVDAAPKSEIAKKAKSEQKKIEHKVDKSKFLKKKDPKGSK